MSLPGFHTTQLLLFCLPKVLKDHHIKHVALSWHQASPNSTENSSWHFFSAQKVSQGGIKVYHTKPLIWLQVYISRWWFQIFLVFTPILGEMIQFDCNIFQMGWNHHLVLVDFEKLSNGRRIYMMSDQHLKLSLWKPWLKRQTPGTSKQQDSLQCRSAVKIVVIVVIHFEN